MNEQLVQQIEAIGKDIKILGAFSWWNLQSCMVNYQALVEYFKANGLNKDWLISEPTPAALFMRACSAHDKTKIDNTTYLVRLIKRDADRIVIGIVAEDEINENLEYRQSCKIIFDCNTNLILYGDSNEIQGKIIETYTQSLGYINTYDLSKQILEVINNLQGLHVRKYGGIYFTLEQDTETLVKLQNLVQDFGAGCMYVLPQIDVKQTRAAISESFTGSVKEDIAGFNESIKEWNQKKPHTKSLEKAVEEINVTKEKIKTYARVLKLDVSSFEEPISSIEQGIKALSQRKSRSSNDS